MADTDGADVKPKDMLKKKPWLRGTDHDPGHPYYYVNGRTPVPVDEIVPTNNVGVFGKRGRRVLEDELAEARSELSRAVVSYSELVGLAGRAPPPADGVPPQCKAVHKNLAHLHNHVAYFRGRILTLERMLAGLPRQKSLFDREG
jgi:hypothetical protein